MTKSIRRTAMTLGLVGVAAFALSACGGDDDGGSAQATSGGGTASAGGVTTQTIDGTDVLVDADGAALYSADQEQAGKVVCTDECTSIWKPVAASAGAGASSDLMLGEVDRPDGEKQLTYKGAPLYSFTEESPGELTGDGFKDSFGSTDFTWHAATTSASSGSSSGGSSDSTGGGAGGAGGYGY